ncbi:hypothetical protein TNCV_5037691 [Trichonephila clavipes]|nr:hypothetical protein TNCV_5037691 [Trichonephila clavipes]
MHHVLEGRLKLIKKTIKALVDANRGTQDKGEEIELTERKRKEEIELGERKKMDEAEERKRRDEMDFELQKRTILVERKK